MKHTIEDLLKSAIDLLKEKSLVPQDLEPEIKIERTRDSQHGDYATNLAMLLAKPCRKAPRQIAEEIVAVLPASEQLEKTEIAGAGFINFFLKNTAMSDVVAQVLKEGEHYGRSNSGQGERVILEYVSANPTGPLHVGHGRSAAFGATLAALLKVAGYDVHSEYYVNDAGRQMDILAVSVWLRYLDLCEQGIAFPANAYRGEYVKDIASELQRQFADKFSRKPEEITANLPADAPEGDKEIYIDALIQRARQLLGEESFKKIHTHALEAVLSDIKQDLEEFSVEYEHWFSERSLVDDGSLEKGIKALKDAGHTYEEEGALWFKSSAFGDEKDRVLIRANGQPTYFASDIAYHWNKYDRGFHRVIDVLGADHHGYVPRVRAAVRALGHDDSAINVMLVQFAILYRGGERVQMSTRSGSFVTLRELRDEVGKDAARFFYVARKPEQHLDFDLDVAKSQSNENPVYYIQYAHARICSVLRQLKEKNLSWDEAEGLANLNMLTTEHELQILALLQQYPEMIEAAAKNCQPHLVAYYLRELSTALHSYYNAIVILCEPETLRSARLCLLTAVRQVIRNGLKILGVSAPDKM